jgi:hypothetical protein
LNFPLLVIPLPRRKGFFQLVLSKWCIKPFPFASPQESGDNGEQGGLDSPAEGDNGTVSTQQEEQAQRKPGAIMSNKQRFISQAMLQKVICPSPAGDV